MFPIIGATFQFVWWTVVAGGTFLFVKHAVDRIRG